ncbi:MAG: SAM-dependent methyltransferase, partial [Actinobacteria bacterium]|nr:SAM-dependent methyltransferase [Actinomycetota bacterium]
MINKDYKNLQFCRICGGPFDSKSLKLVDTPLANELYQTKSASLEADKFPLELVICLSCFHVQLRDIVSPERMFSNYVYRSGTSSFFRNHFSNLALEVSKRIPQGSLVVEVGSNDGFLLGELNKVGFKAIGIEPS